MTDEDVWPRGASNGSNRVVGLSCASCNCSIHLLAGVSELSVTNISAAQGMSYRDIGTLIGLCDQRVAQLDALARV